MRLVRDGEGPGEMPSVNEGASTPQGSFNDLHHLDADGEYIESVRLPFYPLVQSGLIITPDHIIHAAGTRGPTGNHPHQIFVYDRAGELLNSFHPSYPIEGDKGISQSRLSS